jgi:predicted DNA-binding protein (MmcQ/YjbR family)
MNIEEIREFCLSLPHTTEDVKWGKDLTFCIGEKMFAVVTLEKLEKTAMSFKCTPEKFAELIEREGIFPAPYVARYHWVSLERFDALKADELKNLVRSSYKMVWEKLPTKIKSQLNLK